MASLTATLVAGGFVTGLSQDKTTKKQV